MLHRLTGEVADLLSTYYYHYYWRIKILVVAGTSSNLARQLRPSMLTSTGAVMFDGYCDMLVTPVYRYYNSSYDRSMMVDCYWQHISSDNILIS